ncbi:hypothetical protein BCV72DRAFT_296621 [Rhizopus microsporus var. microsporus]|uniref:HTH myb-type domain-containing protein n=2 Tax=Rhizopus microsporus TaxID=58291 RepID=A0A2G4T733_RHIZD|nr:uncharacterized protein RHIMIDRAFT_289549 [Rhizopus microsporus ATCC 52813]ORE03218.1 hypothetical protein BCV72DRAFT_296621 [Rhizopus microsporus var. microsporus]PHZ16822.1 hypothetical protein RHIMIDRAFT_289549 [Rhizopus microsporus ATCC 52813]
MSIQDKKKKDKSKKKDKKHKKDKKKEQKHKTSKAVVKESNKNVEIKESKSDMTTDQVPTKDIFVNKTKEKTIKQYQSASDSDDTDQEQSTQRRSVPKTNQKQYQSASDSDDTDQGQQHLSIIERKRKRSSSNYRTREIIEDSDESDFSSDDSEPNVDQFALGNQKKRKLKSNRICSRRTLEYNKDASAADNYKGKASSAFVPTVHQNFFISDSDSDTDSNDDYGSDSFPEWQRSFKNKPANASHWPKTRRFGYSDNLKLEKRIKKICRRENISFQQVQEIFASDRPSAHLKFFQKIARPFPNISLKSLAMHCRDAYHPKRDNTPWTDEEVKKLNELVKVYGANPKKLSEYLNRTPLDISRYMNRNRANDISKVSRGRWTKEDDELLAKAVAKQLATGDGKLRALDIEPLFNSKKTKEQIHNRYKRIRHRIKPDGTLMEDRKATVIEELEYLEKLKEQVVNNKLQEESQLNLLKDSGFVTAQFYYKRRARIPGFEKMKVLDILNILIDQQKRIVESRREEGLLE